MRLDGMKTLQPWAQEGTACPQLKCRLTVPVFEAFVMGDGGALCARLAIHMLTTPAEAQLTDSSVRGLHLLKNSCGNHQLFIELVSQRWDQHPGLCVFSLSNLPFAVTLMDPRA